MLVRGSPGVLPVRLGPALPNVVAPSAANSASMRIGTEDTMLVDQMSTARWKAACAWDVKPE